MKKIILLLTLLFTFSASAQYNILSAVQLNEGQEEQYLALEAFFGPVHDLAIEKGIQEWQSVWKVTSEIGENGPHYIINTGFSSKEQLDAYNNSWTTEDWVALAKEAHKGKISDRRIERIMNNVGSESKERRNYHLETVDRTIWAGGSLEPGDTFTLTPTQALNDDFENYESKFWKPYIEQDDGNMSDEVERGVGNHQKKQRRFGHGHQRTPIVGKQGIHHPVDHVGRFGKNHQLGRHGGDLGQWQKREQA